MLIFAKIYGQWDDYHGNYKWQNLSKCARYYGYEFKAHDSLEDVKATLFCYKRMEVNVDISLALTPKEFEELKNI